MTTRRSALSATLSALLIASGLSLAGAAFPARAAEPYEPGDRWEEWAAPGLLGFHAGAAAATPDGAVLVSGIGDAGGIVKLDLATGAPRTDFGRSGYLKLNGVIPVGSPFEVAARPDGGAYVLLQQATELTGWHVDRALRVGVMAVTAAGELDPGFGELEGYGAIGTRYLAPRQGAQITGVGDLATVADDRVVVAWTEKRPGEVTETDPSPSEVTDVVVRRLGPDGQVDPTYGNDGLATWTFPLQAEPGSSSTVEVQRVEALPDGSVLVLVKTKHYPEGGTTRVHGLSVVKLTPAGDLHPAFGDGGAVEVPGALPDCGRISNLGGPGRLPLAVRPDGGFVVASDRPEGSGSCNGGEDYEAPTELLVNAFEPDGTPDTEFSADGRLRHRLSETRVDGTTEVRPNNAPVAALVDGLGRVVVLDRAPDATGGALVRFSDRGELDSTFGAGAGRFDGPLLHGGLDLVLTDGGDYVAPGVPPNPYNLRLQPAALYLADATPPVAPDGPALGADFDDAPAFEQRQDRAFRPGDRLTVRLGRWTGAIDRFEVTLLGCSARDQRHQRCHDAPLARTVAPGTAASVEFTAPAHTAGQYLTADVTAVGPTGVRSNAHAHGASIGPSRHLIVAEEPGALGPLVDGRLDEGHLFTVAGPAEAGGGTVGSIYSTSHERRLRIAERRPGELPRNVLVDDEFRSFAVRDVKSAPDGWVHAILSSYSDNNFYALSRDPATGRWEGPVKLSNTATDRQDAWLSRTALAVARDGRAVVTWTEDVRRDEAHAPPVAVRTRTAAGWDPVHYVDEPAYFRCSDGTKLCFLDPETSDGTADRARYAGASISDDGVVHVSWVRAVAVGWSNGRATRGFTVRRAADGTFGAVRQLTTWHGPRVEPLATVALADGSTLLFTEQHGQDYSSRVSVQHVPAGQQVDTAAEGEPFPGRLVRTYADEENLLESMAGDPRHNGGFVLTVSGTAWRAAIAEQVLRTGRHYNRMAVLSGLGDQVSPTQVLRDDAGDLYSYGINVATAPNGGALFIARRPFESDWYALAEGNGPVSEFQPLAVESGDSAMLFEPPSTVATETAGNYGLQHRDGAWQVATLSRDGLVQVHRLAAGVAGPRVAIRWGGIARPGRPYTMSVDPDRSFDPDGSQLELAWDTDEDGAYDDGTGSAVTFTAPPADSPVEVRVRATSLDGDRAVARQSVYAAENQPPSVYASWPTTVTAGVDTLFTAEAFDDVTPTDALTWVWKVDGAVQPGRTGPEAVLRLTAGERTVRVEVTDGEGATTVESRTVTVTGGGTGGNQAPVVDPIVGPAQVPADTPVDYSVLATDDGGAENLTYTWKLDGDVVESSGAMATISMPAGDHTVSVRVDDAGGRFAERQLDVRATDGDEPPPADEPPTVGVITGPAKPFDGDRVTYSVTASDDGGAEGLGYVWTVDGHTASLSGSSLTTVLRKGSHTVAVSVTDRAGHLVSRSLPVTVGIDGRSLPDEPVHVTGMDALRAVDTRVTVPRAGSVSVLLRKPRTTTVLAKGVLKVSGKGTPALTLRLTSAGQRALRSRRAYVLESLVTFTPVRGAKQTRNHQVTVDRT